MNKTIDLIPFFLCGLAIFVIGIVAGAIAGADVMEKEYRAQAIEGGFAYWEVKKDGSTVFRWNYEISNKELK